MSALKTVLIVGATGLIAASLIPVLRQGAFAHLKLNALIRPGSTKATELRTLGVQTLAGSFEDATLLASLAGQYDIVLDMADSAKPDVTKALVEGMKARPKGQGVLIHLTGTGNFLDGKGTGEFDKSGKVWDDANEADIALISPQMFNGAGDRIVLDAGADVLAYVLCAGGVFADHPGMGSYGVFNRLYSNNAKQLGYAPYIGDGSAVMALLHVDDVVAALLKVLALAVDPANETRSAAAESRWYNAGGKAIEWKTIAEVYGKALGLNTKQVAADHAGFMAGLIGSNMLVKDSKLTALGWKPVHTDLAGSITSLLSGASLPL